MKHEPNACHPQQANSPKLNLPSTSETKVYGPIETKGHTPMQSPQRPTHPIANPDNQRK